MRRSIKRGYLAATVLTIAIALFVLSMISPVISTTVDFSIFNSSWNGTSNLATLTYQSGKFSPTFVVESTGADLTIAQMNLNEIELDPIASSLIIIGPTDPFSTADGEIVKNFVSNGGILLLADDFGTGNSLLEKMNASSRFSEKLVLDLAFQKKTEFSVCFNLEEDPITNNVSRLLLNYPSSIIINSSNADALAWTSVASWLDISGDRTQDWEEPRGPFTILARERLDQGAIILLSDPSVLINGMRDQMDNGIFADNLINEVSSLRSIVYFDESHREYFDPVAITTEFTGAIPIDGKVGIVLLAFFLMLWMTTDIIDSAFGWTWKVIRYRILRIVNIFRRRKAPAPPEKEMSVEELVEEVSKRHPDWKKGLIRYVIRERERHRKFMERDES